MIKPIDILILGAVFVAMGVVYQKGEDHLVSREIASQRTMSAKTSLIEEQAGRILFLEHLAEKVFGIVPDNMFSIPVEVTAYTASPDETNGEPWLTADMTPSRIGLLAVSRDLLDDVGLTYGQLVILEGLGVFKVRDTMNKRFSRRVDILMAHKKAARLFGKHTTNLIWVN